MDASWGLKNTWGTSEEDQVKSVYNLPANTVGSLEHYLLYCQFVKEIRNKFVPQRFRNNPNVSSLLQNEDALMISILDPESSLLPEDVRFNWESTTDIYELSRNYVYNIHKKYENYYEKTSLSLQSEIIQLYKLWC